MTVRVDYDNANLKRLAEIHIARFERHLRAHAAGLPGYRPEECRYYLAIWQAIDRKVEHAGDRAYAWALLTEQEAREVREAVESGE